MDSLHSLPNVIMMLAGIMRDHLDVIRDAKTIEAALAKVSDVEGVLDALELAAQNATSELDGQADN